MAGLSEDDLIIVRFSRSDHSTVAGAAADCLALRAQGW